jgi:hypothetical protein
MPGTNGADRVGGCVTFGPEAVVGGALAFGAGVGADSGLAEGAEAVDTGRRPAQPVSNSAAIHPGTSQRERKNGIALEELRSTS